MKQLKLTYPDGKFYKFQITDDDNNVVGELYADRFVTDHLPTVESMTKFQNVKIIIDGKSLKRLQKNVKEYQR